MFKAIRPLQYDCYEIVHSRCTLYAPIPYRFFILNARDPQQFYFLHHNNRYANSCPTDIAQALALILEYRKRNINIPKNLALYYHLLGKSHCELTKILAYHKFWFSQNSPELGFDNYLKCISNQIKQYHWINNN